MNHLIFIRVIRGEVPFFPPANTGGLGGSGSFITDQDGRAIF